eukprot:1878612-Prymnesium_polylepis.1
MLLVIVLLPGTKEGHTRPGLERTRISCVFLAARRSSASLKRSEIAIRASAFPGRYRYQHGTGVGATRIEHYAAAPNGFSCTDAIAYTGR